MTVPPLRTIPVPHHGTLALSESAFLHNAAIMRNHVDNAQLCAVLKANAYGHGLPEIVRLCNAALIRWACVYSLDEAAAFLPLIAQRPTRNLLVLAPFVLTAPGELPPQILDLLRSGHLRINLTDPLSAHYLDKALEYAHITHPINVHVQIDTGLTRVGCSPEDAPALLDTIINAPLLSLEGIFSHFSHGDVPNHSTLAQQLETFHTLADPLKKKFPNLLLHAQNSGGTFNTNDLHLDLARVGIALLGLQPSLQDPIPNLRPVATLTAPILAIHDRPANTGVGYGHTFTTARDSRLAIVPVGYTDGYPRSLSNGMIAQLHGHDIPLVGRVSMDQLIFDITDLPPDTVHPGDPVTVISNDPTKHNALDQMASAAGTIGYELATHLGQRLHRVITD